MSNANARVRRDHDRTVVELGGAVVPQAVYCDYILRGNWVERNREFARSGVRVFQLNIAHGGAIDAPDFFNNALWPAAGEHPDEDGTRPYSLNWQATKIIAMQPQARFYIKVLLTPPLDWTEMYPDQMQTDEDGVRYREPSWSSPQIRQDHDRYLRHVVRFCEGQTWGERIVGYLPLPYGEGCMPLNIAGKMFDCSAANEQAFRTWLQGRYAADSDLQAAWNDAAVRLATVGVPRDRDWYDKRRRGPATINGETLATSSLPSNCQQESQAFFHWLEAANCQRERDYCLFMRDMFLQWARQLHRSIKAAAGEVGRERIVGIDAVKQHQIGWQIQSSFDGLGDGQSFASMFPLSGTIDVGELLDDEHVDCVWNPADYFARTLGFAYESEGLTDSFRLRGKMAFVENDARTYVGSGVNEQGAFRTPTEVEAGLLRNAAMTISHGVQGYWCNVGSSYFNDRRIQRSIKRLTRMMDDFDTRPHHETCDAIAFVVDDTSPLYEDFTSGYQTLALIMQRIRGLAHCGVPYRIYLLSDLAHDRMPAYKAWFFPNLFRLDAERLELLRRKVLRNGNLAVFGPATGITDGSILTAAPASELLGVEMELLPRTTVRHVIVQDHGHPISQELTASLTYGDSMPYGPTLTPVTGGVEAAGGVALGHANTCWFIHRTGLFLREFGRGAAGNGSAGERGADDWAAVWSVALPLPAALLRACARFAGCNVWCEEDDVIYASDSMVAIHSVKAGARRLQLPRPRRVTDAVTGRPVGSGRTDQIQLRIKPPQTRIFHLEDA